jgi:AcrR family transcriptional regulator
MPRHADVELEGRILDAALKLWNKGGDQALTMRGVARVAGTTTPSLYQRFRSKADIRRGLRRRAQQAMREVLVSTSSPREVCEKYLEFALAHPHQYQLVFAGWPEHREDPRPNLELLKLKYAQWLGGSPEEQVPLLVAVLALLHGSAAVLISQAIPEAMSEGVARSCIVGCMVLVENSGKFSR